jgi:ubiquinol-cytochrome c reductase iron-sulfur subunit
MPPDRRQTLTFLAGAGLGGVLVGGAIPFVKSLYLSDEKERPFLDIEIDKLRDGQMMAVAWVGKPLYILKRSSEVIDQLERPNPELVDVHSEHSNQPAFAKNAYRSLRPDVFVAWGICTHLGCSVSLNPPGENSHWGKAFVEGNFLCPCHGSLFDLAGRVYENMPAKSNLAIPPYEPINSNTIRVERRLDI